MNYDDGQFILQTVSSSKGITSSSKTLPPLSRPTAAVDGDGDGDYERQLEDHLPGRPAVISVAAVLVFGRYFRVPNFCFGAGAALVYVLLLLLLLFKVLKIVLFEELVEGWMQGVVLTFVVVIIVVVVFIFIFIILLFLIIVINVEALKSSAFWSRESRRGAKDFCAVNSLRC